MLEFTVAAAARVEFKAVALTLVELASVPLMSAEANLLREHRSSFQALLQSDHGSTFRMDMKR